MAKTVEAGETFTVDEDKRLGTPVTVEGDLVVEQTLTVDPVIDSQAQAVDTDSATATIEIIVIRELTATSIDVDSATAITERVRDLIGSANDVDSGSAIAKRSRELNAESTDIDAATGNLERIRALIASAVDSDSATTLYLPSTTSTDPKQAAIDIIKAIGKWPGDTPLVKPSEQVPHKTKENTLQPAVYIHKPTVGEIERFSADRLDTVETETVNLTIWILEGTNNTNPETLARQYRTTLVNLFSEYMNDNFKRTEFHNIEPTGSTDFRQEHIARQTDHYIYTVEIETERLR